MKSSAVAILVIFALLVGVGLGEYFPLRSSTTSTQGSSTTFNLDLASSTTTICTVGAQSFGVLLRLVNSSGEPITNVTVNSYSVGLCLNQTETLNNPMERTNASGWATILMTSYPYGNYYLSFNYNLLNYTITVPTRAMSASIAIFDPYTGNLTVTYFPRY